MLAYGSRSQLQCPRSHWPVCIFQVNAQDHQAVSTLWSKMDHLLTGPEEDFEFVVRCEASTQISLESNAEGTSRGSQHKMAQQTLRTTHISIPNFPPTLQSNWRAAAFHQHQKGHDYCSCCWGINDSTVRMLPHSTIDVAAMCDFHAGNWPRCCLRWCASGPMSWSA
jgi:hypothetical protein